MGDRQLDLQWGQKSSLGVASMDSVTFRESRFWGRDKGWGQSDLPRRGQSTLGPPSVTPTLQGPTPASHPNLTKAPSVMQLCEFWGPREGGKDELTFKAIGSLPGPRLPSPEALGFDILSAWW